MVWATVGDWSTRPEVTASVAFIGADQTIKLLGRMNPDDMMEDDHEEWKNALDWAMAEKERESGETHPDLTWKERLDLLVKRATT